MHRWLLQPVAAVGLEAWQGRRRQGPRRLEATVGGAKQIAYNGHLLYFYTPDAAAGDTGGQGVGGVWHVVGADGNTIT